MEFKISRTSMWSDNKPCDKAYQKEIIKIDERGFKSFEEYKRRLPNEKEWVDEGFNHKILPANEHFDHEHIYREFNKTVWMINFDTLEELLEFQKTWGDLIITNCYENPQIKGIEIYDDWRE